MSNLLTAPESLPEGGFLLPSRNFLTRDNEAYRNQLTDVRVGKVSEILFATDPAKVYQYANWYNNSTPLAADADLYAKDYYFDQLPLKLRNAVYAAETIIYLNSVFEEYLKEQDFQPWEWPTLDTEQQEGLIIGFRANYLDQDYAG